MNDSSFCVYAFAICDNGDWIFTMLCDGLKAVRVVRLSDIELLEFLSSYPSFLYFLVGEVHYEHDNECHQFCCRHRKPDTRYTEDAG